MSFVTLKNLEIYYEVKGKGKPVVFLHGIFSESFVYEKIINLLSKKYKVFSIDVPFHGRSENPRGKFTIDDIAEIVGEFVKVHKIKDPIVYAHSGGCLIAILYALRYEASQLVLIQPAGIKYYKSMTLLLIKLFSHKLFYNVGHYYSDVFRLLMKTKNNILKDILNPNYWNLLDKSYEREYYDELSQIKCPVTFLWGKDDTIFPIGEYKTFEKYLNKSELVEIEAGHDWPIYEPELVGEYLKRVS